MSASSEDILSAIGARPDVSRGRQRSELPDPLRNAFEVDRHRVMTSAAFRRLEYKTQVFVTSEHDHFRTRLTHTLEVAEISRRLAVALEVHETLAEVIALAHDLGHAPFGHAGEVALRGLMNDQGGFEHNLQSLRVVDYLEHPYPAFRGLNLTYETREGLLKHVTGYDRPDAGGRSDPSLNALLVSGPFPSIEGQIACIADRIAYDTHDLEDALGAGLLSELDLSSVSLWAHSADPVRTCYPQEALPAIRRPILDRVRDALLADAIAETRGRAAAQRPNDIDSVRNLDGPLVVFSESMRPLIEELESFLFQRVYRHHRLVRMDDKAGRFIERLFHAYVRNPGMLPERFARRIDEQGVKRVVCDYIAGMTDRFCQDDYKRLFEPFERV